MNQPETNDRPTGIARLCTCERSSDCAAAVRRILGTTGPRVYELRSAAAVFEELDARPASVILWEVRGDSLNSLAEALHRQNRDYASSIGFVVGERRLAHCEWLLREAGAVHAVFTMRHLDQAVRIALRHLAMVPLPPATWQTRIERHLPWSAVSSPGFQVAD